MVLNTRPVSAGVTGSQVPILVTEVHGAAGPQFVGNPWITDVKFVPGRRHVRPSSRLTRLNSRPPITTGGARGAGSCRGRKSVGILSKSTGMGGPNVSDVVYSAAAAASAESWRSKVPIILNY